MERPETESAVRLLYLRTHENDVRVRPQPIHKDLHHLNEALVGQNLQPLRKRFLAVIRLVAVLAVLGVDVW